MIAQGAIGGFRLRCIGSTAGEMVAELDWHGRFSGDVDDDLAPHDRDHRRPGLAMPGSPAGSWRHLISLLPRGRSMRRLRFAASRAGCTDRINPRIGGRHVNGSGLSSGAAVGCIGSARWAARWPPVSSPGDSKSVSTTRIARRSVPSPTRVPRCARASQPSRRPGDRSRDGPARSVGESCCRRSGPLGRWSPWNRVVIDGGNSDPEESRRLAARFALAGQHLLTSGSVVARALPAGAWRSWSRRRACGPAVPSLSCARSAVRSRTRPKRRRPSGQGAQPSVQGVTSQAIGEALAIAQAAGLDRDQWLRTVSHGAAASWLVDRALEVPTDDEAFGRREETPYVYFA